MSEVPLYAVDPRTALRAMYDLTFKKPKVLLAPVDHPGARLAVYVVAMLRLIF
jgi:hypothetical protein